MIKKTCTKSLYSLWGLGRPFFKKCGVSKYTHFEFVNLWKSNETTLEVEQLKRYKKKTLANENSTRKNKKQIIQEYRDNMYARKK